MFSTYNINWSDRLLAGVRFIRDSWCIVYKLTFKNLDFITSKPNLYTEIMKTLGISSNCLMKRPLFEALEMLSPLTEYVEIMSACGHALPDFSEAAESFSLRYSVHSPTSDGNIAEPHERLRTASLSVIRESAEAADELGAETLVIHPGFCLAADMFSASEAALMQSIADLGRMQEEFSVRFVMENLGSWDCCHFRFSNLLPHIRACGLGFCLDVGHANLNRALPEFLQEKPEHVHLHDNHGGWDEHAACGSCGIDFSSVMKLDAVGIIECMEFDAVLESLEYLKRF